MGGLSPPNILEGLLKQFLQFSGLPCGGFPPIRHTADEVTTKTPALPRLPCVIFREPPERVLLPPTEQLKAPHGE